MSMRGSRFAWGLAISLLVFALIIFASAAFFRNVGSASDEAEVELVSDAVRQAAVTCYAVEGAFPATLDYLKDHYGLRYDEDDYIVFYEAFASNQLPDIRVTRMGAEA